MARISETSQEAEHVIAILLKVAKIHGRQVIVTGTDGTQITGRISGSGVKTEGNAHSGHFFIKGADRRLHEFDVLDIADVVADETSS
jgi:hypothetical protein